MRLFGVILRAASITSVIGAAYTSVSFLTSSRTPARRRNLLLIFADAFNGLILPIGFTVVLWVAWRRRDLLGGYRYPRWLLAIGMLAWLLSLYLGYSSPGGLAKL